MIDLLVIRGGGGNAGAAIVESLLCTVASALERGRVEIDKSSIDRVEVLRVPYRPGIRPGLLIQVVDILQGETWKGRLVSCSIGVEGVVKTAELTVERVK